MTLLVIISNPKRASFRQRIAAYLDVLCQNGINCEVIRYPPGSLARYKVLKKCKQFDAVYLHKKTLNFLDAIWLRRYARKIIYDFDDAVMYSPKVPQRNSSTHFNRFRRTVRLADSVIAGNSYLAEHARRFNPNVEILPTGLDTNAYNAKTTQANDNKIRLVWIGSKSTLRYLMEIKPALEEIGSRFDNIVLRIICDEFLGLRNMKVEKFNWSLETQAADLAAADIGLAPLPDNRFTKGKCGFKILQYAAAGLPVVASPVGVNAQYIQQGVNGFLADSTTDWVTKVCQLINDRNLRMQMGQNAKMLAEKFDIKALGPELAKLIKQSIEGT